MRVYIASIVLLCGIACCRAGSYHRAESSEDAKTEFNLASTLTGGITSSRHHAHANVNAGLNPYGTETSQQPAGNYISTDIDEAHGHERSEGSAGSFNVQGLAGSHRTASLPTSGYGGLATGHLASGYGAAGQFAGVSQAANYAGQAQPAFTAGIPQAAKYPGLPIYPAGLPQSANYPGQAQPVYPAGYLAGGNGQFVAQYPGQYLPQYPAYPQPAQFPAYGYGQAGNVPAIEVPSAGHGQGSHHHHHYPPHNPNDRDHWDHKFKMNTEYKEDGVHKGSFDVLNNHSPYGYGSGFGGGYNGAFNRPGF